MIEVRAEGLIRALADERVDLGSVVEPLAVGLRSALGLPFDAVAVRSLPRRDNIGVWQADRVMTEAHLPRERELGGRSIRSSGARFRTAGEPVPALTPLGSPSAADPKRKSVIS
jgi:hypothetical protein